MRHTLLNSRKNVSTRSLIPWNSSTRTPSPPRLPPRMSTNMTALTTPMLGQQNLVAASMKLQSHLFRPFHHPTLMGALTAHVTFPAAQASQAQGSIVLPARARSPAMATRFQLLRHRVDTSTSAVQTPTSRQVVLGMETRGLIMAVLDIRARIMPRVGIMQARIRMARTGTDMQGIKMRFRSS
jgi:hypothetical protein